MQLPPGFAELDLSRHKPSGRMRYDEGAGIVLFASQEQVQAFSLSISSRQPLWVRL